MQITVCIFCVLTAACTLTYSDNSARNDIAIRRKRVFIKQTAKLIGNRLKTPLTTARQWLRIREARETLLIGARFLERKSEVKLYDKMGGQDRAQKDFDMIGVYNVKEEFSAIAGGLRKYGTVGNNVVEFVEHYSESIPYPVVYMYRVDYSRTRSTVTMVIYKE